MSLQSIIGDVTSAVGMEISSAFDQAMSTVGGIADDIGTFVANIYSGGFAGVKDFNALKTAITNYANSVKEIVDEYNANADLQETFKGKAGEEMTNFVKSTKELLNAYVLLTQKWNKELDDIYEKYQAGDTTLQQNVASDAEKVSTAASKVDIG